MHSLKCAACIAICVFSLTGCKSRDDGTVTVPPAKSLYDRIGGEKVIALVVDDFVQRVMANEDVNFTRKATPAAWDATPANVSRLKALLVAYLSDIAGGPVKYKGRNMKAAHAGMKITEKEFFTAAADLEASLIKYEVSQVDIAELMQIVATTRSDIVSK